MQGRIAIGELVLAAFFVALGLLWVWAAARMPLWQGFAPQSGFMPLWYGITLIGITAAVVVNLFIGKEPTKEEPAKEQPAKEEPKKEEPKKEEPKKEEPKKDTKEEEDDGF